PAHAVGVRPSPRRPRDGRGDARREEPGRGRGDGDRPGAPRAVRGARARGGRRRAAARPRRGAGVAGGLVAGRERGAGRGGGRGGVGGRGGEGVEAVGVASDGKTVYLKSEAGHDTAALEALDLATGARTVLAEDPGVDVGTVLFDEESGKPQAASFARDRPRW